MLRNRLLLIGCTVATLSSAARAQENAYLAVESNLPQALVVLDSVYFGRVGPQYSPVSVGKHVVYLEPAIADSWLLNRPQKQIVLQAGDSLVVQLDFKITYRIESSPYGAEVSHEFLGERSLLGETPLLYRSDSVLAGYFVLDLPGYRPVRLRPGNAVLNQHNISLAPTQPDGEQPQIVEFADDRLRRSRWINVLAFGLVAAGAVTTVHYKFKADRRWDVYQETTDPLLKEEIDRLDRRAAVSLGAMQVGVAILVIRLAF